MFGETTIKDASDNVLTESAIGNPYGFTGRRLDTETDNYYYRMRYYSPQIGRFLQIDPIGYAGGLNFYTYCLNDPVNYVDPFGNLYGRKKISSIFDDAFITIETQSGEKDTYQVSSRFDLKSVLKHKASSENRITRFVFVGHGLEGNLYMGDSALIGNSLYGPISSKNSKMIQLAKQGIIKLPVNLESVIKENFAPDAVIILKACQSAIGEDSVAKEFKELLPEATVIGYTGKVWPIGTTKVVKLPFRRVTIE
ncbi:MAG TPA: RHS repeat-associated core domain-containing protein [Methanosarcinales archaeon]|nr:RHS repeat-associated core domain-containing protein [Methanosarcinales archaeon]